MQPKGVFPVPRRAIHERFEGLAASIVPSLSRGRIVHHSAVMPSNKPNMLILWGDDIGIWNISAINHGMMGYQTPNLDRLAREGLGFTDYYGQQSCTAGRASFITGQNPVRTGLTKVGLPGADLGLRPEDPTIAKSSA